MVPTFVPASAAVVIVAGEVVVGSPEQLENWVTGYGPGATLLAAVSPTQLPTAHEASLSCSQKWLATSPLLAGVLVTT